MMNELQAQASKDFLNDFAELLSKHSVSISGDCQFDEGCFLTFNVNKDRPSGLVGSQLVTGWNFEFTSTDALLLAGRIK